MARKRLLVVTLVAGVCLLGIPLPAFARQHFPRTVSRSFEVARGATLRPTAFQGATLERGARTLPIQGNLISVSFRSGADHELLEEALTVEARFRTARGWGAWERLWVEPDEAPDEGSSESRRASHRQFTAPLWVGTADRMSLRVAAEPAGPTVEDLRVHVINSKGDAAKPTIFHRVVGAVSRFLHGTEAFAMTTQPSIITREQWGANESWRECCPVFAPKVHLAFVHHTAGTNSYAKSESAAIVRSIYLFHTSNRGWSDIGYNFLVDKYGQIFEGRYGGITSTVRGAHVMGFNSGSTGISLMGNFQSVTPTSSMVSSLQKLLAWKLDVHHVPPTGTVVMTSGGNPLYPVGTAVRFDRISGHRDGQQTSCPGTEVYYRLPSIRSAVNALGLPKIYLPAISTTVLRPNGDTVNETVTLSAQYSQTLNWKITYRSYYGQVLRVLTGSNSPSVASVWNGRSAAGQLPSSGVVRYTLEAYTSTGLVARPVEGLFYLVSTHPDGTVLRSATQTVMVSGGRARPIPNDFVLESLYRAAEPVAATDAEIARYAPGPAVAPREGTVMVAQDGSYWMISNGLRRAFSTSTIYSTLGYTSSSALSVTAQEAALIPVGSPILSTLVHPDGAVVKASDGSIWTIRGGKRLRNPNTTVATSWYRGSEIVPATAGDMALSIGDPITYRTGTLFRLSNGSYWIFYLGRRHKFHDPSLYTGMGYSTAAALSITTSEANTIPVGQSISEPSFGVTLPPYAREDDGLDGIGTGGR